MIKDLKIMKSNNINTMKRGSRSVVSTTLATAYIEHSFSIHSAYIGSRWQAGGKLLRLAAMMCLLFTLGVGNVWADYVEFTTSSSSLNISGTTYTSNSTGKTIGVTTVKWTDLQESSSGVLGFKASTGCIWNTAAMPANIDSIVFTSVSYSGSSPSALQVYGHATTAKSTANSALYNSAGTGKIKVDFTSQSYKYFYIKRAGSSRVAKTTSIKVYYTSASCGSATPSATGAASLNGSFNMTSTTSAIGVSTSSWNPGSSCSWSDYGFVWSDGTTTTTPTVSNNKVQVGTSGSATSWTGSVTPSGSTTPTSWTTGHTYYVRAYGKNNNGSATYAYGSAWSFTPRSVTFKANGGTGSDKVQYVQGGVSTALTSNSFTKTGYNFNGWNTDADGTSGTGYTNGQSVSLSGNLTLYAKWTAKTTTISFNQNSGSGGQTGTLTATYDAAMPSAPVTCPTRTGYDFGGYYDGSGGTGTQYYTSTGASARNWNKENSTWTLYAKWTIKSYTVTWKVNNANYTTGGPTDNVNHGSSVSKLPTAPDPDDYCGEKFVGWTDADGGVYTHGTSNLYTKAADFPNATGNQIFYAVFADYDE